MITECLREIRCVAWPIPINLEDLDQALDKKSQGIQAFRNTQRAMARLAQELSRAIAAQRKAEMNARFWEAIKKMLTGGGASDPDVNALLNDWYFKALVNWDDTPEAEQERLQAEQPETIDLAEAIEDARYDAYDLSRWLAPGTRRMVDDVMIPVLTIGAIIAGDFFLPGTAPATAPALVANCARVAPILGRLAVATGIEEILRQTRTFFSENFSGGKDKGKADASSSRIKSTPQDADKYLGELQHQGVLGKKQLTTDHYEYYEFTKKCNHNGVRFRKGDLISRDTLHHEWEWFRGKDVHKGPISSKTGRVNIDKARKDRFLKIK